MKKLLMLLMFIGVSNVKADVLKSTSTLNDVRSKVVELHITFAPAPNAEVKRQRKTMAVKAGKALCSGALVSPYGHILTAKHCAADTTDITAVLEDGQEYTAAVRALSTTQDLAILQIGKFNTPFFKLGSIPQPQETVWIIGSPLGLTGLLTQGIVAKLFGDYTLLDCTAAPGNSGGPVFNNKGELVGILTSIFIVYMGPSHISVAQSVDSIAMFFYEFVGGK